MTDESGTTIPDLGGELQLAGYLDGLIAAALARKASPIPALGWTLEQQPEIDPVPEASGPPEDPVALSPDQAGANSNDAAAPAGREAPPAGRASMSEELAALFRPTDQPAPPPLDDTAPSEGFPAPPALEAPAIGPSDFLRRFIRQSNRPREVASSGIAGLDARLAGGFGPGLHVVTGPSGADRAGFLDSVVWEAVASGRPVVYYALREGSFKAWQRLISTLGGILDVPGVRPPRLQACSLSPVEVDALTRLDVTLQRMVLPLVSLVESGPAHPGTLSAFVEDLRARAREAEECHGKMPLLVVDDLEWLSFLVGCRRTGHALFRLDEVLSAESTPGLLAAGRSLWRSGGSETASAQTTLALGPVRSVREPDFGVLDLRLLTNSQTGWTGVVPLLVDHQTGLFSDHPGARERRSVCQ